MNRKFIVCVLFSAFLGCFAGKIALAEEQTDNAATYYNKAFELLTYSHGDPLTDKVMNVVQNGWTSENKELEALLKENEPAFVEFEKGLKLNKCDFTFGEIFDSPFEESLPNFLKVRTLVNLINVKISLHEYNKEHSQALEHCYVLFTFGEHISQNRILVSVMLEAAIEQLALRHIQQYLEKKQSDLLLNKEILAFLQDVNSNINTLAESYEKEKTVLSSFSKQQRDKIAEDSSNLNKEELARANAFARHLDYSCKTVSDKYYGALIKCAQTNSETDGQRYEELLKSLLEKFPSQDKSLEEYMSEKLSYVLMHPDARSQLIADSVAELLAVIVLPNLSGATDNYYCTEAKFRVVKTAAAIRVYAAEKKKLPEKLADLVPEYLQSVPIDPWAEGKELKYNKIGNSIVLYSFGPDRTDNFGIGTGYESAKDLEGKDIVFSFTLD